MADREKLTISLDAELVATVKAEAAKAGLGVSEWVASAVRREADRAAAHRTLIEWEVEHGPLGQESE